jgi:CheY-specific phosphatase CheX
MEAEDRSNFGAAFGEVLAESGFPGVVVRSVEMPADSGADILCSVGIAGGLSGFLILGFMEKALASVARRMTSHIGLDVANNDAVFLRETAAELANQLAGRAVNALALRGIDCAITPPTIVSGSRIHASIPHLDDKEIWNVDAGVAEFRISVLTRKR